MSKKHAKQAGVTLIDLSLSIAVIGITVGGGYVYFGGAREDGNAVLTKTVQSDLEQVVSQASIRLDASPNAIMTNATERARVVWVVNRNLGLDSTVYNFTCTGMNCSLASTANGTITFAIATNGKVTLTNLAPTTMFKSYRITNGELTHI